MTVHFFFQYANIRQIPIAAVIVQSISYDKSVGDFKSIIIDRDIYFPARRLTEQRRNLYGSGPPFQEKGFQFAERNPRIYDIFDDEDIPAPDITVQVFTDLDKARRSRRSAITGADHEIKFNRTIDTAGQIGKECDGPL